MKKNVKKIKLNQDVKDLFNAFSKIDTPKEREIFFHDLLSPEEMKDIARRWKVARMLSSGTSFTEIEEKTGMSSTTIARISKWMRDGYGGYQTMIDKEKK
ncbi:MAG: hypothetical protein ACD_58C00143G0005 [uncultured bacterium]|nr:MAG: hypothetical protein ACD_58C00143G0005 [uncultured bacterium]